MKEQSFSIGQVVFTFQDGWTKIRENPFGKDVDYPFLVGSEAGGFQTIGRDGRRFKADAYRSVFTEKEAKEMFEKTLFLPTSPAVGTITLAKHEEPIFKKYSALVDKFAELVGKYADRCDELYALKYGKNK